MKKIFYIAILSLFGYLQSCVEPIDLEIPDANAELVVVSNFEPNQPFKVIVTQTVNLNGESKEVFVENVKISIILDNHLLEVLSFQEVNEYIFRPFYFSKTIKAEIGRTYEIRAEAIGFETVVSKNTIPEPTVISNSRFDVNSNGGNEPGSEEEEDSYELFFELNDPADTKNFYHLNLFQKVYMVESNTVSVIGPLQMYPLDRKSPTIPYFGNRGVLIDDASFNGKTIQLGFEVFLESVNGANGLGELLVELRTVSWDYYHYHLSLLRQSDVNDNPLSVPVLDYSNIDNGKGVFAGFSVATDTIIIN